MQSITNKNSDSIKFKTEAWQAEFIFKMILVIFLIYKITILVFGRFDKYATKTVKIRFQNLT